MVHPQKSWNNTTSRQQSLPFTERRHVLRQRFVGDSTAKHLLRVLEDFAGDAASCWPSQETIADAMETDVRTVRRKSKYLKLREFIHIEPPNRWRKSFTYILRWAEMCDATNPPDDGETPGQGGQIVRSPRTDCPVTPDRLSPEASMKPSMKPPPPPPSQPNTGSTPPPAWSEEAADSILDRLRQHLDRADELLADARQRLTPADVAAHVDEFERRLADGAKIGAGVLGVWLKSAQPGERFGGNGKPATVPHHAVAEDRERFKVWFREQPEDRRRELAEHVRDTLNNAFAFHQWERAEQLPKLVLPDSCVAAFVRAAKAINKHAVTTNT